MTFRAALLMPVLCCLSRGQEAPALAWYLPADTAYSEAIPTPSSVLGWEVGTWHVRHDQLLRWFETLDEASPRMAMGVYGKTHEERPLVLAAFSSPENLARLDEIRSARTAAIKAGHDAHEGPQVVWMGYSVHGNESSGANASILLAYHLAAAEGQGIEELLRDTIVLIDPCLNPDGLARFAQWANSSRGDKLVDLPLHRERREPWPGGRTNHYWFDLNRDWLLLTHPESQARLREFHRWMPAVLTDYHEMGSDSTYFFQPGIPSRQNPHTPGENLALTRRLAEFHASALDATGSLYYTEESFDDFYYGKGSTYPDINGCIGILFEQASSRGHLQDNSYGGISFPFTIRNQLLTSLSTLSGAQALKDELGAYQRGFYRTARQEAAAHPVRAYVLGAAEDPGRTLQLVDILTRHDIQVHYLAADLEGFPAGKAFIVPLDQPQHRLIRAIFETRTSWPDNTFYDVSSWTLPLSFDVPYQGLDIEAFKPSLIGPSALGPPVLAGPLPESDAQVAWVMDWRREAAAPHLAKMLQAGVRARVSTRTFKVDTATGTISMPVGSVVIPTGIQDLAPEDLTGLVRAAAEDGVLVHSAASGLTPEGIDLGSGSLRPLRDIKPVLLVGDGVSGYEAGEAWHHLDRRLGISVPLVECKDLPRLRLADHSHLLLVSGAPESLPDGALETVRQWVQGGGVLVATRRSAAWAAETFLGPRLNEPSPAEQEVDTEPAEWLAYGDYEELRARHRVAGAIFKARLDNSHPLCFGLERASLPVFRNSTDILALGHDPFSAPVRYAEEPLLSGYASGENIERIAGSPAILAERHGRGAVICMVDNPLFRGVWRGTARLYTNALFFGSVLKVTGEVSAPEVEDGDGHGHKH